MASEPLPIGRMQCVITYALSGFWLALMVFAAVSSRNPEWLRSLSQPNIDAEARDRKNYGDDFMQKRNFQQAIARYKVALELKPDYIDARVNMAIAYSASGNQERALSILKEELGQS